jgi:AAA domain
MLRITKASDLIEVKTITLCIYAVPGVGKTTLGFTAERPLLLDFDKGAYRAGNRGDTVLVETWSDVESITAKDLEPFRTVVIDTAGRALDALTAAIIAGNPKMGRGGALTLQGFGELKARFIAWTKNVRSFGLDVVLIAHSDEQRQGDEIIERLDMQGGSKNEVYKSSDVMGRLYLREGKRMLNFSPTDTAFGKNPAQLPALPVPNFDKSPQFLADVIQTVKDSLNHLSTDQQEMAAALADWKAKIEEAATKEHFDGLVAQVQESAPNIRDNVKRLMIHAAKKAGLQFSVETGDFQPIPPRKERAA